MPYARKLRKNFSKRWWSRLYEPNETKTSEKQLEQIFKLLKDSACLLGGWAVYYIVNKNFEKTNGRSYIGSRDIDIGFHVDKNWTEKQLKESHFNSAIKAIENIGFKSVSFRLVKNFDTDTGKELAPEESAKLPLFRVFQLFIDPIVDYIHPKTKDLLGFVPIDEPLLSLLFQHKMYTTTNIFETKVMLPRPELLLAMKLKSALTRGKEHKRTKDIADIYALLWYSDTDLPELKNRLRSIHPKEETNKTLHMLTEEDLDRVSKTIGVTTKEISRVLAELK